MFKDYSSLTTCSPNVFSYNEITDIINFCRSDTEMNERTKNKSDGDIIISTHNLGFCLFS